MTNDAPVTAVMLLPPFYFHPLGEAGLRRYLMEILAATSTRCCFTTSPSSALRYRYRWWLSSRSGA